jgi:hypothetical protein
MDCESWVRSILADPEFREKIVHGRMKRIDPNLNALEEIL